MMSLECRSDLVLRERRGPMSSSDELALRAHLDACEICRMTREISAAFDEQSELERDDGARIAKLAARARAPQRRFPIRRGPRIALIAACLTLLTGVAAAAAFSWMQRPEKEPRLAQATRDLPHAVAALTPQAKLTPRAADAPPQAATNKQADGATSAAALAKAPAAASPLSAAQLFRKANDARRTGQAQQAIQLYRSLQRDYPGSAEAALSPVSLGGLLLNRASAGAALEQFDHYLAASPGAALAAEALYGRARALQALGRNAEEKRSWEQLLSRFPGCPYRETARRRLSELG
jgi:TolA-binding protein